MDIIIPFKFSILIRNINSSFAQCIINPVKWLNQINNVGIALIGDVRSGSLPYKAIRRLHCYLYIIRTTIVPSRTCRRRVIILSPVEFAHGKLGSPLSR